MRLRGNSPSVIRVIFVICVLWVGGMMGCPDSRSENRGAFPWTGKFPVLVIAHRGFSGTAPENTLIAFKKAADLGVDMIELDVHLSKDGHPVVIHDDTVNRTTNGKGKVAGYTLDELKQFDAGSWLAPQFSGEKIPTLKETLELLRGRVLLNIELKEGDLGPYTMKDLADRSLQEVEKAGMLNQVLFGSFDLSAVDRIREKNLNLPVALISNRGWSSPQEVTGGKPFPVLSCRGTTLTPTNVSTAHQHGIKVLVWTVDTEDQMERFLALGVDGIVTNHPDKLIKILQKRFK